MKRALDQDATRLCACGHQRSAHEHYRRGSDCSGGGGCDCTHFAVRVTGGELVHQMLRRFAIHFVVAPTRLIQFPSPA